MNTQYNRLEPQPIKELIISSWDRLVRMRTRSLKSKFEAEFKPIMEELEQYVRAKIRSAERKRLIPRRHYRTADIVDQLYLAAYEEIIDVGNPIDLQVWLFQKADVMLEDIQVDASFNEFFFENIDKYTDVEWKGIEEKYTRDADGDYILEEELEEQQSVSPPFVLKDVFTEDSSQEFIENLSLKLSDEDVERHLNIIVTMLPLKMQSVFNLSIYHKLDADEIAAIRQIERSEVVDTMEHIRATMKKSLSNRFKL